MLTQERLKEFFYYDDSTGVFTRIKKNLNHGTLGEISPSVNGDGYSHVRIDGKLYKTHRLAWLYVYGSFPSGVIDHINRVRADNRIANLRDIPSSQNTWNRSTGKNNTTGYTGVTYHKRDKKFYAHVRVNWKRKHLGYFDNAIDASNAVIAYKSDKHKIMVGAKMKVGA